MKLIFLGAIAGFIFDGVWQVAKMPENIYLYVLCAIIYLLIVGRVAEWLL